jgi:GNAT superfamily N-acetyltransferase
MSVNIVSIAPTAKELKKYVRFGIDLYKGNPYYVPPLIFDEVNELRPEKNPSSEFCESQSFMAYRDGKPVGRVTAIINRRYNEKTGEKVARFGYVDFIDDAEVVDALFETVKAWGRERGMTTLVGPLGFSDMDKEGMLIEGFEEMGTMATIYNHPYYPGHMERMGFEKEADWIEFRMKVPDGVPEKMHRIADIVSRKFGLHIVDIISRKWVKETYGQAIFDLINEAYKDLYGYTQLTERQINYYIDMYLGILRLEDVCLIADSDDKLIGLGISMPSMSRALQKGRGRLFPFGWYHLLRAVRGHSDVVDLLLVAISPEYQGKGVNALLFDKLIPAYIKNGYKFAESNVELEGNENVQKQWEYFERRQHRRRRAWKLKL